MEAHRNRAEDALALEKDDFQIAEILKQEVGESDQDSDDEVMKPGSSANPLTLASTTETEEEDED